MLILLQVNQTCRLLESTISSKKAISNPLQCLLRDKKYWHLLLTLAVVKCCQKLKKNILIFGVGDFAFLWSCPVYL